MSEIQIRDTILHEVAHALTPGDGHGHKWQQKLIEIGGNPNQFTPAAEFIERYLEYPNL